MDHLVGHTFCCQCHALLAFWSGHASSWTNIWWHLVPFLAVKPKFLSQGSICATHFVKKVDLSFSTHVSSVTSITIWHIEQFRRMAACAFQSPCGFWNRHAHTEGPKAHAILQHTPSSHIQKYCWTSSGYNSDSTFLVWHTEVQFLWWTLRCIMTVVFWIK